MLYPFWLWCPKQSSHGDWPTWFGTDWPIRSRLDSCYWLTWLNTLSKALIHSVYEALYRQPSIDPISPGWKHQCCANTSRREDILSLLPGFCYCSGGYWSRELHKSIEEICQAWLDQMAELKLYGMRMKGTFLETQEPWDHCVWHVGVLASSSQALTCLESFRSWCSGLAGAGAVDGAHFVGKYIAFGWMK